MVRRNINDALQHHKYVIKMKAVIAVCAHALAPPFLQLSANGRSGNVRFAFRRLSGDYCRSSVRTDPAIESPARELWL
jgi:hypothetical protein